MPEEIRGIRADELDTYMAMAAQAFQVDAASVARWRQNADPDKIFGLFADGEMRAGLTLHDMEIGAGPAPVRAGGLAAVATPPEWRRQGIIGRLLRLTLDIMRERDQTISILYPFYFPFYKHYGWEHVSDNHHYTIPIDRLPLVPAAGTWHAAAVATTPRPEGTPAVSDADLAVFMEIYEAWAAGRVGPLVRDAGHWQRRKLRKDTNAYYWRDPAGRPRAYILYTFKELGDWERRLTVDELTALDPVALRAALGFLRNHDSQAKEVALTLPEDARLLALLDDPRIRAEVHPGFMLRFVDVPAALAARRYPPGLQARLVLAVAEGWVDRTPRTYRLDVADGRASVAPSSAAPAFSLDQRTLAQLYTGYLTPGEAAALGLLQVHDPAGLATAAALFAGPRPYLPDHF